MRRTWLWGLIVVALAALAGTGLVVADDADGDGVEDAVANGEDTSMGGRRAATTDPEEQVVEANRIQADGTALAASVFGMLGEARNEGDVVRVPCLDDVLTQINAAMRTLEPEVGRLQVLVRSSGDPGVRNHVFTIITIHGQHLVSLERQANDCEGASLYETGTTFVATYRSPTTMVSDPSDLRPYWELEPYLPLPASGE